MKTEITTLPLEVNELAKQVSESKQEEVLNVLNQIFIGTDEWDKQVDAIEVKDVNDTMSMQLADVARKNAKIARLGAEKLIDSKRAEVQNLKASYDLEDKLWLKTKQVMQLRFKAIEDKASWKANFVKRFEAEKKEVETQRRINEVSKYSEINRIEFENMGMESFEAFINGLKTAHEYTLAQEAKAEADRLEALRLETERIEAQRIENEKLKLEAEKREKEIEAERKKQAEIKAKEEVERKEVERVQAEKLAKEKAKQDAILEKEREVKRKLEAELKAKQDAENKAKAEAERIAEAERVEAENKAKAPIKEQLTNWVNSLDLQSPPLHNETVAEILTKFNGFKKWAKTEIEKI